MTTVQHTNINCYLDSEPHDQEWHDDRYYDKHCHPDSCDETCDNYPCELCQGCAYCEVS